ncbi:endonuclease [Maribacter sp. 4U21]|uniref:endonuclease/exonuclease/phosphatase family protein n=1 Tax=Maribacter sp. 4U21 TaxID=1889779 RepID=UPI000C160BD4|nr:endonuclease/exonuclease/phosphatase family protein [Maribacter sp. 4U21]PIB31311.1 endonuclease [Maribacter sp. 4U21]
MFQKILLLFILLISVQIFSQQNEITIVSWNIQDFGKTKSNHELEQIAEVVRDVDIVAIQEVVSGYGGAQAVAKLSDLLNRKGAKWDYVISDPTNGTKYASERYAFVWKTEHIKIKNRGRLLKELDALIDREPFFLDFYIADKKLILINFHSRPYNKNPEAEIIALTQYMNNNITGFVILAGDFNVDDANPIFDPLKKQGYSSAVTNQKTTLKRACDGFDYRNHAIDNIFYSNTIAKTENGVIDFVRECENLEMARKISDHLPVYLGFKLR